MFYVTYIVAGILAKPDWAAVGQTLVAPSFKLSTESLGMIIGLVGTTIAPWMQFYLQAAVVEKNIALKDYKHSRLDVILGSFVVTIVAGFIVLTCAATLFKRASGSRPRPTPPWPWPRSPENTAPPCSPSACSTPRSSPPRSCRCRRPSSSARAWAGRPASTRSSPRPPSSTGCTPLLIFLGAGIILIPGMPLFPVMYISQVLNGLVLPVILIFMLLLVNNKRLMGEYRGKRGYNIVSWTTVGILVVLSVVYLGSLLGI